MLAYLGLPTNFDEEFSKRDIQKPTNETLNIYDVEGGLTLNKVSIFSNLDILGDYKINANAPLGFTRTYPLVNISANSLFGYNRVNDSSNNIPPIVSIPFWNYARGDGKGFSVDLGHFPVRLKVFQDVQNTQCNRLTISTRSAGVITPKQTVGYDVTGDVDSSSSTSARAHKITADKTFTAKYLGVYLTSLSGSSQMAIYSSTGTFLGKTEIKTTTTSGRQLYLLESPISIVNGENYWLLFVATGGSVIRKVTTTGDTTSSSRTVPLPTTNLTVSSPTNNTLYCFWAESNWEDTSSYVENNALNIWANGMLSIGTTLDAATYTSAGIGGDGNLNPYSLLVQNDIMSGLSGLKTDCTARLHIKASNAEFTANRYIALFQGGDGLGAAAITKDGEIVIGRSGMGIIMCDSVTNAYYRLRVTNGALSLAPF